ncbi:telomere binding protein [Kickxella alabastrina]|uniref:Telomere binding protein n=1 Tax=Kickxella alabastrina TaxID=61397 RepID=A0ACC1IWX4_9FUNG|nr:telomere binding protein [Kickxella alabastrina]
MAVWVVQQAVERGILDPAQSQQRIQQQPTTTGSTAAQRVEWTEYVQLVCSVPDRVYNRVDPRTIPHALTPAVYFARLARCVVEMAALVPADETSDINVGLWIKMCRVGEINSLCVEVASRLLLNGDQDTSGAGGRAEAEAEAVARAVGLVLVPFRARIVAGVARQLSMALGAQPTVSNALGERVSLAICTLLHAQLDADVSTDAVVRVVSALMDQTKTITTDCFPSSSALAFFQALALALQMLSGRLDVVPQGVPSRVYPQLLVDSLISVIIPQWSMADFVTHASAPEIKAMTALVMMCIGALSELDAQAVASSAEFMHAVPRFLDAPMAVTRLSGILVADCVVSKSNSMAKSNDQEKQGLDFGLDDIMREAKSGPPEVRASAAYIAEMRLYTRPIAQQWMQKATPDTDPLPPIEEEGEEGPASAVDQAVTFMRAYNGLEVVAPRQSSLTADTGESPLQSDFVKPRAPMFLRDCLLYMRDTQGKGSDMVQLGLFSLTQCIEAASEKMIREWWVQVANRVLYTYNRGADDLDREWNHERVRALVALAVRAPEAVGPFLADRACDRNLTLKDREIVYAAISTACLTLSGMEDELVAGSNHHQKQQKGDAMRGKISEVLKTTSPKIKEDSGIIGSGTVTRRSRRLDLVAVKPQAGMRSAEQKRYASTVGPAFFFPLMSQFGKSDMAPMTTSDVRRDMGQLERYVNTLAIILYTAAGSATHLITMNREFFDLFKMLKACSLLTPPVIDALLFGIDVVLSPERALSLPTLAREFREDISMIALWINELVEQGVVRADGGSIAHHVESIMRRLRDIQDDLSRRVTSGDFHKYTSVISI